MSLNYHAVTFSTKDVEYAELTCTTADLNKVRKLPGYVEIDYAFFGHKKPMHIQNAIKDKIVNIGEEVFKDYGWTQHKYRIEGTYASTKYGYFIYRDIMP